MTAHSLIITVAALFCIAAAGISAALVRQNATATYWAIAFAAPHDAARCDVEIANYTTTDTFTITRNADQPQTLSVAPQTTYTVPLRCTPQQHTMITVTHEDETFTLRKGSGSQE